MSVIVAERVAKTYEPFDIFWDVSCSVAWGDRVALVGRNGTGKTTLLNILAGLDEPSRGKVHRARGLQIGYLPQGAQLGDDRFDEGGATSSDERGRSSFDKLRMTRGDKPGMTPGDELGMTSADTGGRSSFDKLRMPHGDKLGMTSSGGLEATPLDGLGATLWQEMMSVFGPLREMEGRLHKLELEMANPARAEAALETYAPLRDKFESLGGYTYQDQAKHVLMGLGFPPEEHEMPLAHLSGGQKTRAYLAKLLLESPDLLLLDEPTNHLDLQAIQWLEGYLNTWEGTVVLVAHDRYFMDRVVRKVWELAFGRMETYTGNYSHYVQQRASRHERLLKEYRAQEQFIAKEEDFIRRYMAGQRTRQAQGRLKRLERFKRDKALDRPREEHTLKLQLQAPLRSGDKVIWTQDLEVGYDQRAPLFYSPDLDLRRGECVALLGPNGSGKTTFLKTVLGEIQPLAGYARLGASLKIGYFAQVHADLDPAKTVLDSILDVKNLPLGEARSFLGRFLFSGDDVFKLISELSGGERSRVALARLVMQRANFLLLDEPTNHLDIASQEVLEEVLDDFEGTIVLVTHDRYLVDRLATQLWVIEPKTQALKLFRGTWAEYLEAQNLEAQAPEVREAKDKWSTGRREARREEQRIRREEEARQQRAAEVEEEIHQLEAQLKALKGELDAATAAQEAMRLHELGTLYGELEGRLQQQIELWAELAG